MVSNPYSDRDSDLVLKGMVKAYMNVLQAKPALLDNLFSEEDNEL